MPGDPTAIAAQKAMRDLDLEYFAIWLHRMDELNAEQLDHSEFTQKRTELLQEWTKQRKLAQGRLNTRYNPQRRNPALVLRDVETLQRRARRDLADYLRRRSAGSPADELERLRKRITRQVAQIKRAARSTEPDRSDDAHRAHAHARTAPKEVAHG